MSLTPAEVTAINELLTPPSEPSLESMLIDLNIDPGLYFESLDAKRDFVDYLAAVGIQDLYVANALTAEAEVVNVARQFWPLNDTNLPA